MNIILDAFLICGRFMVLKPVLLSECREFTEELKLSYDDAALLGQIEPSETDEDEYDEDPVFFRFHRNNDFARLCIDSVTEVFLSDQDNKSTALYDLGEDGSGGENNKNVFLAFVDYLNIAIAEACGRSLPNLRPCPMGCDVCPVASKDVVYARVGA